LSHSHLILSHWLKIHTPSAPSPNHFSAFLKNQLFCSVSEELFSDDQKSLFHHRLIHPAIAPPTTRRQTFFMVAFFRSFLEKSFQKFQKDDFSSSITGGATGGVVGV
jgi:hypothetical protein